MAVDDNNLKGKADLKEPESGLRQEIQPKAKTLKEASVTELISFSKFTLIGIVIFFIGLFIQFLIQTTLPIAKDDQSRWAIAVMGITLLILFGGLVIDVLNWRDYTEWGALGAIISYFGVILIFITFPLNIFWYVDPVPLIYMIIIIIGVITMIIGFTTRATELDQKIVDQFFIFKEWVKAGGIQQALSALKQLIVTVMRGFFKYIGIGLKELGTRIKRFAGWIKRSIKLVLGHILTFFTKTFPNVLKRSLTGLWNNLHWFGVIAVFIYLIMVDIPVSSVDQEIIIKAELLVIIGFFFCLGVLYPQRDRVVIIAKTMRNTVLSGVISAYSMLSGTKIKADQSVFCSRCLRGVERREFVSLMEIKRMVNPPCPFCGFNNWIGSEHVSIPIDKLKQMEKHEVQTAQKTVVKDTPPSETIVTVSDKKAFKKGRFPDYQSYHRAQNLGARTYSELEYIDRLGAPDLVTAEKIKEGGFSHFQTFQKALTVGASSVSELRLVEELNAPDLATAKEIQKGRFPDYQSYQRAQDLGVEDYSDLHLIDRLGAPDLETAEKIRIGGFSDFSIYQKALAVGASSASELRSVEELDAPDLVTVKEIQKGRFPDYQTFQRAPDLETARKIENGGFSNYKSYQQAQNLGARNYSELQFIIKRDAVGTPTSTQTMVTEKSQEGKSSRLIPHGTDIEVKATLVDHKAIDTEIYILEFQEKVVELSQSIDEIEWNIEWQNWFLRQTEQYHKAQISETTYKSMLKRYQNQYLDREDTHKMQQHEKQALDEIRTLFDAILTGKIKLIRDRTPKAQIDDVKIQTDQKPVIVEKKIPEKQIISEEDIWFTKDRESLKYAIEVFTGIFTDRTLQPKVNQDLFLWNNKKTWFSGQKKRFLKGNISTETFYGRLKDLNRVLRSTFRVPTERFQTVRPQEPVVIDKKVPELLKKLLKLSQRFITTNKEVDEWYDWFTSQTDQYLKSQIEDEIFIKMLNRSQEFYLELDSEKMPLEELRDYEEILSIIHTVQKMIIGSWGHQIVSSSSREQINAVGTQTAQEAVETVVVEKTAPDLPKKVTKEKIPLLKVVGNFDSIFADDSLVRHENREKWDRYKKEYYQLRARFLDFSEISGATFCSHLKKVREFFVTEMSIPAEKMFEFEEEDIDYALKTIESQKKSQKKKQISVPDLRTVSPTVKKLFTYEVKKKEDEIPTTEKDKAFLNQAIESFDAIFAGDSLVRNENRENWENYMKEYYQVRARFFDFGEITEKAYYSYLKKLRKVFITEMGFSPERLFKLDEVNSEKILETRYDEKIKGSKEKPTSHTAQVRRGKLCPSCGASLSPKPGRYCNYCGEKLLAN